MKPSSDLQTQKADYLLSINPQKNDSDIQESSTRRIWDDRSQSGFGMIFGTNQSFSQMEDILMIIVEMDIALVPVTVKTFASMVTRTPQGIFTLSSLKSHSMGHPVSNA